MRLVHGFALVVSSLSIASAQGADSPKAKVETKLTYHKDVVPLLQKHCQGCHRPGQVGPFSLMTYKQAVNWADDIKGFTHTRKMPPWKPVGGPAYKNDRQMDAKEIALLGEWVDAGCPEGNPADAPPAVVYSDEWQNGAPDMVLTVPEDFHVGPEGNDVFRCFVIPTGLTEDKYIVGYEVKPGNPRVVHHTLNFWDMTGKARELAEKEKKNTKLTNAADHGPGYSVGMGIGFLPAPDPKNPTAPTVGGFGGWAPGQMAVKLPDDVGFYLPAKADVVIQTHYHRTGKAETDRIKVGLYFAKKPIKKPWQSLSVGGLSLLDTIPAGKADFKSTGSLWILHDATVHSVIPHMHLIGKSIKVTMYPPEGESVVLIDIPAWDYNWQETYWLKKPIAAKAGTRFEVEAVYDNSAGNPNNPSKPPQRVFFGEQTTNEMLFGFVGITPVGDGRVRVSRTDPKLAPAKPGGN